MALFSWLVRGLAARPEREAVAGPEKEPLRHLAEKGVGAPVATPSPMFGPPVSVSASPGKPGSVREGPGRPVQAAAPLAAGPADADTVELPLSNVLECVPLLFLAGDAEQLVGSSEARSRTVRLPLRRLLAQLPSGRIEFRFDDLRPQIPDEFLAEQARGIEEGEVPILLDLADVVKRLPSARLARRDDQVQVKSPEQGVPDLVKRAEKRPVEAPLRETARLAMAASSMPILPGSALRLEGAGDKGEATLGIVPRAEAKREVILPGAASSALPGDEPVTPVEPLFVRKSPPKPALRRDESAGSAVAPSAGQGAKIQDEKEAKAPAAGGADAKVVPLLLAAKTSRLATGGGASEVKAAPAGAPAGPVQPMAARAGAALPTALRFRAAPRARVPAGPSLAPRPEVGEAGGGVARPGSERSLAAGALARWLGVGPGRDILIREIPGILTRLPGVSGAIISDREALTVARQLPPGIPEEAISSSASLLYKRLRHAAAELGGGFTNQTLVGLGQWTLVITCEPPFFLTTVHATHVVPERLARRMRKVAKALARLEVARPVG